MHDSGTVGRRPVDARDASGDATVMPPRMHSVTIIAPVMNEGPVLSLFVDQVVEVLNALQARHDARLLLIDDGSTDGSWSAICACAAGDPRISGLRLSRNFGHQAALTCGYELADADAIVTIDSDLQDPPAAILDMVAFWERGARVVLGVRRTRRTDTGLKRLTAALYYWLIHAVAEGAPTEQTGDFRLLDRQVVDALNRLPERHRYIRGLVGWLGFTPAIVEFDRQPRAAGVTKYPIGRMIRLAVDGIVSLSFIPLRVAYVLACASAVPFLLYLLYNVVLYFAFGVQMVPGWSSLILAVTAFGAANLLVLGILGEYVGRIYSEVKRRPIFVVAESCGERAPAWPPRDHDRV